MIITLCGSTKFKKEYELWNIVLTLSGHVVFSCALFSHVDKIEPSRIDKAMLDVIHFKKIDLSDGIFVINKNGYIGESTEREIVYAKINDKFIWYSSSKHHMATLINEDKLEWVRRIQNENNH